jgi:hypothetical protein
MSEPHSLHSLIGPFSTKAERERDFVEARRLAITNPEQVIWAKDVFGQSYPTLNRSAMSGETMSIALTKEEFGQVIMLRDLYACSGGPNDSEYNEDAFCSLCAKLNAGWRG